MAAAERSAVIKLAADEIARGYVFEDAGGKMSQVILGRLAAGAYDTFTDPVMFAEAVTRDLRSVNNDAHLSVSVRPGRSAAGAAENPSPGLSASAIERTVRLAGNVGYLKINTFPSAGVLAPALDKAMSALKETDALIVDLRDNRGGTPDGAMYLAGFFFARPTLVARIYSRQDGSTTEMRTGDVTGPRYLDKSLFILTSRKTFSAGEAVAYHLKHAARAVTVGEASGGGAHRVRGVDLNGRFTLALPFTRPISVVTNGDWEGTGVLPDLPATAEGALTTAHLAALRKLPSSPERDAAIRELERRK
jgi:C-terminal processing protease CtpA/Prc